MQNLLEAVDISKEFGGFHALDGVSLQLRRGSIHAVVGENGAGKSTLMKVIAGVYPPSGGVLRFKGADVIWTNAESARREGISTIFQEFILLPNLSVAENMHLGWELQKSWGRLDRKRMAEEATRTLARLGASIDPACLVSTLNVAEQQLVEIGKGMMRDADVFVFDEPTAALGERETKQLFELIRDLKAAGKGVLYVSHRLPEVMALCDTVTVLKDGICVQTLPVADATPERIVTAMVGRKLSQFFPPRGAFAPSSDEVALCFIGVVGEDLPGPIDFELYSHEIVGLAGLEGHGQRETLQAIFGEERLKAGEIRLFDKRLEAHGPRGAMLSGFGLVPEDRKTQGLFLTLPVKDNVGIGCQVGVSLWRFARSTVAQFAEQVRELNIRLASPDQAITDLSGGNQQKTLLARWLARGVAILVCEEPTRGVDIGAKAEIYRILRRLADQGTPVLITSRELPELIGLCDRIVVLRDGRTVGTVPAEGATEDFDHAHRALRHRMMRSILKPEIAKAARERSAWPAYAIVAVLIVGLGVATPNFLSFQNALNLLNQNSTLVAITIGQGFVIIAGGLDLSVGAVVSLTTTILSLEISPFVSIPLAFAAAAFVGTVNGLGIVRLGIHPILMTLGSLTVVNGIALLLRPIPGGRVPDAVTAYAQSTLLGISTPIFGSIVLIAAASFVLNHTRFGLHVFAVGGSGDNARLGGVRSERVVQSCYILSSLMAAAGGFILAGRIASGDPLVGAGFEIDFIAATALGGTLLAGGLGSIGGPMAGVAVLALVSNGLNLWNVATYYQMLIKGALLVFAVSAHRRVIPGL